MRHPEVGYNAYVFPTGCHLFIHEFIFIRLIRLLCRRGEKIALKGLRERKCSKNYLVI